MSITLYYHPLASYCHKVLIALYEHGTPFEARIINLGDPADRAELAAIWPLAKFPVIRDHARDRDLAESSTIIEYLDHHHAGSAKLIPPEWDDALDVRLWDRFYDNHVQGPMQAIVADRLFGANSAMEKERAALHVAYRMIDERMASREWAAGPGFSMADCAAVPALYFAATLEPFPAGAVHLSDYFERLVARPSVKRVLEEAKPYLKFYPFAASMPARFMPAETP